MYVAVKGGEKAINNAHALLEKWRSGQSKRIDTQQIDEQLFLAVDRVMTESGVYDRELGALAIKQSAGDLVEAIFLLRAYRTTLPRFSAAKPIDTAAIRITRRISAVFKDLPGGQILGPTYDYTHRLLNFSLLADGEEPLADAELDTVANATTSHESPLPHQFEHMFDILHNQALATAEPDSGASPVDITEEPVTFPCLRSSRLQQLTRGDEGFLLALGYSTQRGYGRNHPFAGEIRSGHVMLWIDVAADMPELADELDAFPVGEILITECEMVTGFVLDDDGDPAFTRGYSVVMGHAERKAMSVALVDRALQAPTYGERIEAPVQDEEFVLEHVDNVQASGFVSHLKLPHYVDFQAELALVRSIRARQSAVKSSPPNSPQNQSEQQPVQQPEQQPKPQPGQKTGQ